MQERRTDSDIEIKPVYSAEDIKTQPTKPGAFPFVRGVYPHMYRDRLWTMRQYAGFGTAEETNERFKFLLEAGQTGLSCAFDLPTQMGIDSDDARAEGEVGRVGVAIDSVDDMRKLLRDIPLDQISLSMTINATAPLLLLLVQIVAEENGFSSTALQGTVQNDILKEYIARGTYIYPPQQSLRLVTDTFAYCQTELPKWHPISISGYHIREAGSSAAQEIAFTLSNAIAYVDAALAAGLKIDEFAPRLSFFWNAHNNFLEEVAKFRAARRIWAYLVRDKWHGNEKSQAMRFHVQTGGSTLVAQQPVNNVVRTTLQALAAIMGGTQSLHTNGYDEAIGLPTEESARTALRTQQIIAFESGVADTADPFGGSFVIESLTDQLEAKIVAYIDEIAQLGGAVAAIEKNFMQSEIERSAVAYSRAVDKKASIVVGVNSFIEGDETVAAVFPYSIEHAEKQIQQLKDHRSSQDSNEIGDLLEAVGSAAKTGENTLFPLRDALRAGATIGQCSDVLREVFGIYSGAV
jgi:methylmalonyl-CoA mutase N-terminal domain/subunit